MAPEGFENLTQESDNRSRGERLKRKEGEPVVDAEAVDREKKKGRESKKKDEKKRRVDNARGSALVAYGELGDESFDELEDDDSEKDEEKVKTNEDGSIETEAVVVKEKEVKKDGDKKGDKKSPGGGGSKGGGGGGGGGKSGGGEKKGDKSEEAGLLKKTLLSPWTFSKWLLGYGKDDKDKGIGAWFSKGGK